MCQNSYTDHFEHLCWRGIFISILQLTYIKELFYLEMPLSVYPFIRLDLCFKIGFFFFVRADNQESFRSFVKTKEKK